MPTLADSYTNAAGLRTALRNAVGHPNQTVLITDGTVDTACQQALDKLNADYPLVTLGTFATVSGQQAYSPLPASAYGFRRVYWPLTCGCPGWDGYQNLLGTLDTLLGPIDEHGTRTPTEPAAVAAFLRQQSWLRGFSAAGSAVVERTVYLDPIPASVQTVPFTYHSARYASFLAVADGDRQRFLDLVKHYIHAGLSAGAGAIESVEDTGEGTVIKTSAPERHEKLARAALASYQRSRPPIRPVGSFP